MSYPPLEARDLQVCFDGRTVLDITSLKVVAGEVLAIIGPNGAGKSVLLSTLSLLLPPTRGVIEIDGQEGGKSSELLSLRRRMAMVMQEPLLLSGSVQENVELGLCFRHVPGGERKKRAALWMGRFGISHLAGRQARTLSGGEAQRVSLARAFVIEPHLLFLDEPFSALDPPTHDALIHDLRSVLKETGTTTIFVTHSRDEALALAHRVGVLMGGRLLQIGSPSEVFASPVNKEVANFVGMENILAGEIIGHRDGVAQVRVPGGTIEAVSDAPVGQQVLVGLRPEEITLLVPRGDSSGTSARNQFSGRVLAVNNFGGLVRVSLDCGFPLVALITRVSGGELGLKEGSMVRVSFKASVVHLIPRS